MVVSARQRPAGTPPSERERTMFEAFKEILADRASRAEFVGALIECGAIVSIASAYYVSIPVRKAIRRLRYGTAAPRIIVGRAGLAGFMA